MTLSPAPAAAPDGAEKTRREILQQPSLWSTVAAAAAARRDQTEAFLAPLLARPDLRVVLTGAGTSAFIGEILAPALTRRLERRVEAISNTAIVSDPRGTFAGGSPVLLISFARSGDSPESVAATRLADELATECHHIVITCNPEGLLHHQHREHERSLVITMPAQANDQAFAMTSSFTCMLLAASLTLDRSGSTTRDVTRLVAAGEHVLSALGEPLKTLAPASFERVVYLGSGPLTGLARESALKILEMTAGRIATWSDSPLGFRHGPKSVLNDRTLAIVYLSSDPYTRSYDLDIVHELRSTVGPARVVVLDAVDDTRARVEGVWHLPGLAGIEDDSLALPYVLCAQLLGLHASVALGLSPDNPFPSGEINRVVQGVTIYPLD